MKNFIVFINSGKILREGVCPANSVNLQKGVGEYAISTKANIETDYIPDPLNPVVTPRPSNPTTLDKTNVTANGVDKVILTGVPLNSVVTLTEATNAVPKTSGTATNGTIDLFFDIAGTYNLKVELFPYLDFEATINAT